MLRLCSLLLLFFFGYIDKLQYFYYIVLHVVLSDASISIVYASMPPCTVIILVRLLTRITGAIHCYFSEASFFTSCFFILPGIILLVGPGIVLIVVSRFFLDLLFACFWQQLYYYFIEFIMLNEYLLLFF